MKIVAINGSPKGKGSNTNVMVSAFLKGAQEAGADTLNIFLSDKDIKHCKGCHTCWSKGPGQCVTSDDMLGILSQLGGADIIVFATPVYFANISGMLKVFMDRMTMIGGPHSQESGGSKEQDVKHGNAPQGPKLMMISNCGFPDRDEFQVVSLWIKSVAQKMHMELAGEIYAPQGKLLSASAKEYESAVSNYLHLLAKAGQEIALYAKLSEDTNKLLEQPFIPNKA